MLFQFTVYLFIIQKINHNTHNIITVHYRIREGNGTPLQYSCVDSPMDRGAWWAAVHGIAKSRTGLSDFTFTFIPFKIPRTSDIIDIYLSLSDLFHSVWQSLDPSMLLKLVLYYFILHCVWIIYRYFVLISNMPSTFSFQKVLLFCTLNLTNNL